METNWSSAGILSASCRACGSARARWRFCSEEKRPAVMCAWNTGIVRSFLWPSLAWRVLADLL